MKKFSHLVNRLFKDYLIKERCFLILTITLLVIVWFRKGLIIGSGESGLPFYNTPKLLNLTINSWTDVPLGTSGSLGSASFPLYWSITLFEKLGVPTFILQAIMYWIIFAFGVISIHIISSKIKNSSAITRLGSALFYIFNPVVHVAVLHRVQYPFIFFYGLMPFSFLIYSYGLANKKIINLIWLAMFCVIFSIAFVSLSSLELMFLVLGSFTLFYFYTRFKKERDLYPLFYFVIFLILFFISNAWWISLLFTGLFSDLGVNASLKYFDTTGNIDTFVALSNTFQSVLSVFRLFPPNSFPPDESSWGWIYATPPFIALSFFFIFAFCLGFFKRGKEFVYKFFIVLTVVTIFFMKGSLPPLGNISLFLIQKFSIFQVFRNSFEKISLLLPFAMAIPLGFGFEIIIKFLTHVFKVNQRLVAIFLFVLIFPIYMFPITTGYTFTGGPPPSNNMDIGQYVKVPDYYPEASSWLDTKADLFRVLVLPLDGEGMTYQWEYGFSGVELSNTLFNQSMISFSTSQAYLTDMTDTIREFLFNHPDKLWQLAQLLNVKYIMVRSDVDYLGRSIESPQMDLDMVGLVNKYFSQVASFGKLKFFQINQENFYPRVYVSTSPTYLVDPEGDNIKLLPFTNLSQNNVFLDVDNISADDPYFKSANQILIKGKSVENFSKDIKDPFEILPYVSVFPDNPLYRFVKLKEDLETSYLSPNAKLGNQINLMGKRIVEINHNPNNAVPLNDYNQMLNSLVAQLKVYDAVDQNIVSNLYDQKKALEDIKSRNGSLNGLDYSINTIDNFFTSMNEKSIYPTEFDSIYRFSVPNDANYELLIANNLWTKYYKENGISKLNLDGKVINIDVKKQAIDQDTISLGLYYLQKGLHEVSFEKPVPLNLVDQNLPQELVLSSHDKEKITMNIPLKNLDKNYNYTFSFEYFDEKGNDPVVAVNSVIDSDQKTKVISPISVASLIKDNYDFGWKEYTTNFTPNLAADSYNISITVLPYGNCKAMVEPQYQGYCNNEAFNKRILQDSTTRFRNIKVEKIFENPVMLKETQSPQVSNIPTISFQAISPALYDVKVSNAQSPFFLVLSTTYDPKWGVFLNPKTVSLISKLSGIPTGEQINNSDHLLVNGYSNAWYIDKLGSYNMVIEYTQETEFTIAKKISLAVFISLLVTIFVSKIYVKFHN